MSRPAEHRSASHALALALVLGAGMRPPDARSEDCQGKLGLGASIVKENENECAVEASETLVAYRVVSNKRGSLPSTSFFINDRIVLCIRVPFNGYISVWDAPPNGDREKLFPNPISHPDGKAGVFAAGNTETCIGEIGSGYEVKIPPHEGLGRGQFYLLVTDTEEKQLGSDDFAVPGYGLAASVQRERPVEDLKGYADTWFTYNVERRSDGDGAAVDPRGVQPANHESAKGLRRTFECSEPSSGRGMLRIMGGTAANSSEYPWQVAIKGTHTGLCGGSLIGPRWVLTAAHCVASSVLPDGTLHPGVSLKVYRPDADGGFGRESRDVRRGLVHPDYDGNAPSYPNDIAVLEVSGRFEVEERELAVLATGRIDALYAVPKACAVVTGWGTTEEGSTAARLRQVFVPVRAQAECESAYRNRGITAQHLCAGYDSGEKDSCQGDSGGPLLVSGGPSGWIQVGVVSWGDGCARPGLYGVYQRVGHARDWIDKVIAGADRGE